MLRLRVELGVRGLKTGNLLAQRRDGSLHRGPVIDEMRDWYALRELLQAADMIDVVVRGHQVVDLRHAGIGESRHDPVGVPATGAAGVHEHRLPARRARRAWTFRLRYRWSKSRAASVSRTDRGGRRCPRRQSRAVPAKPFIHSSTAAMSGNEDLSALDRSSLELTSTAGPVARQPRRAPPALSTQVSLE